MLPPPTVQLPHDVRIRHDLQPGDIGMLIYLHGVLYAEEEQFDHTFEAHVAHAIGEFAQAIKERERLWIVEKSGHMLGCVAIVERSEEDAQFRFFLLHPSLRGLGLGKYLIQDALDFCRKQAYKQVYLWTVSNMTTAITLYTAAGFILLEEKIHPLWGKILTEQRYELRL